jgi:hypothetical protein
VNDLSSARVKLVCLAGSLACANVIVPSGLAVYALLRHRGRAASNRRPAEFSAQDMTH